MSGLLNVLTGGLVGLIFGGRKSSGPKMLPQANRDAAEATVAAQDELSKRRGAAADMMNGTTGYEAGAAQVGRLVVGS